MKDESTNTNNLYILDDIYQQQFALDRDTCPQNIRLIYGDLKTVKRILAVKTIRRSTAQHPYDQYDWLIPGLGLWHLRLNLLQMLHRIHWGGPNLTDPTTLQFAADRWHRHRVVQPNDFQALEDLIIHSYQARICGFWLIIAQRRGLQATRLEDIATWFYSLPPGTWSSMLDELGNSSDPNRQCGESPVVDEMLSNHRCFCAHVESYLLLKYAIKYADIGLLRYAIRDCMIMFQAKAGAAPQYARELIRLLHLTDSEAASPELQRAVLTNGLVNLHGLPGHSFETDRLLELLNNALKYFQRERSSFVHDSDRLLRHWAINGPFFARLKDQMERTFGKPNSPRHAKKPVYEQLLNMAHELQQSSVREQTRERFSAHAVQSLHLEGLKNLSENISRFNNDTIPESILASDPNARHVSADDPIPDSPFMPIEDLLIDVDMPLTLSEMDIDMDD